MRSRGKGGLSATTQVKVLSPEIVNVAQGQGFHFLEASTAECAKGEHDSGVPGSESVAGNRTVHIGTWESQAVPEKVPNKPKRQGGEYGGMAVGPTRSRGVAVVMRGEDAESTRRGWRQDVEG